LLLYYIVIVVWFVYILHLSLHVPKITKLQTTATNYTYNKMDLRQTSLWASWNKIYYLHFKPRLIWVYTVFSTILISL